MPRVKGKCDMNSEMGLGFAFFGHHKLWEATPTPTHTPIPQGGGVETNIRLKTFMPRVMGKCDMNSEIGLVFAFL